MSRACVLASLAFVLAVSVARASAIDDARKLHEEAQTSLREMSSGKADPKAYADVVRKLEKAHALLEEAAKSDPNAVEWLQQSVSAALFWARRFSTVDVAKELSKPGGKTPDLGSAEAAYRKAEEFEKANPGDDYAIALRWFQYSDQYTGTDWSLRALARAYEAQARYKTLEAAKKGVPQTEDGKFIAEGNVQFMKKDFDGALAKFEQAKKLSDTVLVERRMGHAYLELGYKLRDEYAAQYLPLLQRYNDAVTRGDRTAVSSLRSEAQALVAKLRPLEDKAIKDYDSAEAAFQRGLDLAKGKDLDCEAHLGIVQFARGKKAQPRARTILAEVIAKYTPANDEERTVYEFSRSLLTKLATAGTQ